MWYGIKLYMEVYEEPQDKTLTLPDDIFEDIIGHDEVKELLTAALLVEKPMHVLLTGPPALAKSLFLWDIERAGDKQGRAMGLRSRTRARILLIDELDKMNATDTAALLSLMEGGRLVQAEKGRTLDVTVPIKVVVATNQVAKLSPELKSRFAIWKLKPYDATQYRTIESLYFPYLFRGVTPLS